MEKWRGKNAVVTGASSGIGAQIVRELVNAGINVAALARRVEKLESLKAELKSAPGKVAVVVCDITSGESIESAFKLIEKTFSSIQIMVNNAGAGKLGLDILEGSDDLKAMQSFEQIIQLNFTGLVHFTRKAFHLIEKSEDYGIIINIGSIVGHAVPNSGPGMNVYPGTKFAVRATTEVS